MKNRQLKISGAGFGVVRPILEPACDETIIMKTRTFGLKTGLEPVHDENTMKTHAFGYIWSDKRSGHDMHLPDKSSLHQINFQICVCIHTGQF